MVEHIVSILVIIVLVILQYLNHKERKDLYDRLMSRNFTEYKDNLQPEDNDFSDGTQNLIDIENSREEIENGD